MNYEVWQELSKLENLEKEIAAFLKDVKEKYNV